MQLYGEDFAYIETCHSWSVCLKGDPHYERNQSLRVSYCQ